MPFKKQCNRCGKTFQPNTRTNKLCDECRSKSMMGRKPNKSKVGKGE